MRTVILLFVGVIFIGTGIVTYMIIGSAFTGMSSAMPASLAGLKSLLQYGIGGGLLGVGAIMTLSGVTGFIRGAKRARQAGHIAQTGTPTVATVTFVDKNYGVLVNNRPVYSIVEYTYQDNFGNEYSNRIENIHSESVIRNMVEVGSKIRVKYSSLEPSHSAIAA